MGNQFAGHRLAFAVAQVGKTAFIMTTCCLAAMVLRFEMQFAKAGCLHELVASDGEEMSSLGRVWPEFLLPS